MSTTISDADRQEWIQAYEQAHNQLDDIQSILAFLAKVTANPSGADLELNVSEYDGLHSILSYLATKTSDTICENLPIPDTFAKLCKGGNHE